MNGILWSDLHLHTWSQCSKLVNNINDRLLDGINVVKQVITYFVEGNYDFCIFCGDLFHKRGEIPTSGFYLLTKVLQEAKYKHPNIFDNWFWLIGNHDQDAQNPEFHNLLFLNEFGTVIDKHDIYRTSTTKVELTFSAHPWMDDRLQWREEYLNVIGKNQKEI